MSSGCGVLGPESVRCVAISVLYGGCHFSCFFFIWLERWVFYHLVYSIRTVPSRRFRSPTVCVCPNVSSDPSVYMAWARLLSFAWVAPSRLAHPPHSTVGRVATVFLFLPPMLSLLTVFPCHGSTRSPIFVRRRSVVGGVASCTPGRTMGPVLLPCAVLPKPLPFIGLGTAMFAFLPTTAIDAQLYNIWHCVLLRTAWV